MKMVEAGWGDRAGGLSRQVVAAGAALGIAGDLLLWDIDSLGPGFTLWVALLGVAVVAVNRHATREWRTQLLLWTLVAVVAASILLLRATPVFVPLVVLTLTACAVMVLMQSEGVGLRSAAVHDQVRALLRLPLRVVLGGWPLLGELNLNGARVGSRWQAMLRGALLSLPLLLIFVALFSSADATFERYASGVGDLLARDLPRHVLIVVVLGWFSAGLLACAIPQQRVSKREKPSTRLLGEQEAVIVLGSLVALFLVFVMVQLGYLFGGREVIEQTSGLTLAQYARRGFFELMVVALLAMAILHGVCAGHAGRLRVLGLVLVALVMCILLSAAQRLALYIDAFGLTLARLLASACMLWVTCCLLMFTAALIRQRGAGLASGYLLSGVAMVLMLAVANPAALVASVNLQQAIVKSSQDGDASQLDVNYLLQLGPDVVPVVLDRLADLPREQQCGFALGLRARYWPKPVDDADWRAWNDSRSAAERALGEVSLLRAADCSEYLLGGFYSTKE